MKPVYLMVVVWVLLLVGGRYVLGGDDVGKVISVVEMDQAGRSMESGLARKVESMSLDDLETEVARFFSQAEKIYEDQEMFATTADFRGETQTLYGQTDEESYRRFMAGLIFLFNKDFKAAKTAFIDSVKLSDTPSGQLQLGFTHKVLGEESLSFNAYRSVKQFSKQLNEQSLLEKGEVLLSKVSGRYSNMIFATFIFANAISLITFIGLLIAWRLNTNEGGGTRWTAGKCHFFMKDIINAEPGHLDEIEEKIRLIGAEQLNGLPEYDLRPLAVVRKELHLALNGDLAPDTKENKIIKAQKRYLLALFFVSILKHRRALRYFHEALEIAKIPSFYFMLGATFISLKRKKAAKQALDNAVTSARSLSNLPVHQ